MSACGLPPLGDDVNLRPTKLGEQIRERKTNRRVPSVYHGLSGTKRERLIPKGFLHCGMVHGFNENRTRIPLKSLAIPAGFASANNFKGLRRGRQRNQSTETKRFLNECLTLF